MVIEVPLFLLKGRGKAFGEGFESSLPFLENPCKWPDCVHSQLQVERVAFFSPQLLPLWLSWNAVSPQRATHDPLEEQEARCGWERVGVRIVHFRELCLVKHRSSS